MTPRRCPTPSSRPWAGDDAVRRKSGSARDNVPCSFLTARLSFAISCGSAARGTHPRRRWWHRCGSSAGRSRTPPGRRVPSRGCGTVRLFGRPPGAYPLSLARTGAPGAARPGAVKLSEGSSLTGWSARPGPSRGAACGTEVGLAIRRAPAPELPCALRRSGQGPQAVPHLPRTRACQDQARSRQPQEGRERKVMPVSIAPLHLRQGAAEGLGQGLPLRRGGAVGAKEKPGAEPGFCIS
jgi:hypothetical protein